MFTVILEGPSESECEPELVTWKIPDYWVDWSTNTNTVITLTKQAAGVASRPPWLMMECRTKVVIRVISNCPAHQSCLYSMDLLFLPLLPPDMSCFQISTIFRLAEWLLSRPDWFSGGEHQLSTPPSVLTRLDCRNERNLKRIGQDVKIWTPVTQKENNSKQQRKMSFYWTVTSGPLVVVRLYFQFIPRISLKR